MTPAFFKWSVASCLMTLALVFTQCGKPFATKGDLIYSVDGSGLAIPIEGADPKTSLEAFEQTVYLVTRQNCTSCHGNSQQPLHASSDSSIAHNALLSQYKVNFTNPAQSRMVKKLKDEGHNCWSNCAADAQEMQDAIADWGSCLSQTTPTTGGSGGGGDFSKKTAQSRTILAERQAVTAGTVIITAQSASAMLTAPMVLRPASGNDPAYIEVPNDGNDATLANNDGSAGIANFTLSSTVARANGALWGLVSSPSGNDDSFHVRINNAGNFPAWTYPATNGLFKWSRVTGNFNLNAGANTVQVREREDGAQLAMILFTPDQSFVPAGAGTAGTITLRYPLDAILGEAGASIEVKIEDYDAFSYRLSGLRLNTGSRSVYVKNIHVLVNNTYNPQHSNYTLVDQLVPMGGGMALSPSNMIVLKEGGEAVDKLSFAFEFLEFR